VEELELTVLLPCLDEAETLADCIRDVRGFLAENDVRGEVVVADNGSSDGSPAIAEREGARVVAVATRGYGAAIRGGIAAARGRFVVMADADRSYDLTTLGPFLERLRGGADLVMGNRFRGGVAPGAMPFLHRYVGNPVLTAVGRMLFRSPVRDFHCGIRGFEREAARRMDLRTTGMELASEMVIKATLLGMRVEEVPTTLSPDGRTRPPHLRTWRDGWRHLRFMLLYSPRWLFLYPGLTLVAAGLVLGGRIVAAPLTVGDVTLDIHSLVFACTAVVLGVQSVSFAVFARAFAVHEGLLPRSPALERVGRLARLEVGVVVGAVLFGLGLVLSAWALARWGGPEAFGDLEPRDMMRAVAPAATAMIVGGQIVLASLLLSLIGLGRSR
jgi:glycosyltransferase involved in cell wall biosynthesis